MNRQICSSHKKLNGKTNSGQIVVEYVMLMIVAIAIASLMMRGCVSRQQDQAGMMIQLWDKMLLVIGEDTADELK
ncbi:MAG: hypothetical protein AB7F59_04495 [Bdellovibrionales bacterium]